MLFFGCTEIRSMVSFLSAVSFLLLFSFHLADNLPQLQNHGREQQKATSTPIRTNCSVNVRSAPSSPQIPAHFPHLCAFSTTMNHPKNGFMVWDCRNHPAAHSDDQSPGVYCVRSFVPMLKKSTISARRSLIITAAGVSIIMPCSGILYCTSCAFSSSSTSATIA